MATRWTPELNALVKQRSGLEKGSAEYGIVQNKINKALGSDVRHNEAVDIERIEAKPIAVESAIKAPEKIELERKNMPKGLKSKGARRDLDAMSSTVASALTGALKNTGTGNDFKAAQAPTAYITDDGKMGGISKADYLKSGGHVNLVNQEDYKPDFDTKALDQGIADRYTDKKALNKAGRSGEISNDEWRQGLAEMKATKKADKAQAKEDKQYSKWSKKAQKEEAKRVAKANKPTREEKKSMKLDKKQAKSDAKFYKKTGIDLRV